MFSRFSRETSERNYFLVLFFLAPSLSTFLHVVLSHWIPGKNVGPLRHGGHCARAGNAATASSR